MLEYPVSFQVGTCVVCAVRTVGLFLVRTVHPWGKVSSCIQMRMSTFSLIWLLSNQPQLKIPGRKPPERGHITLRDLQTRQDRVEEDEEYCRNSQVPPGDGAEARIPEFDIS